MNEMNNQILQVLEWEVKYARFIENSWKKGNTTVKLTLLIHSQGALLKVTTDTQKCLESLVFSFPVNNQHIRSVFCEERARIIYGDKKQFALIFLNVKDSFECKLILERYIKCVIKDDSSSSSSSSSSMLYSQAQAPSQSLTTLTKKNPNLNATFHKEKTPNHNNNKPHQPHPICVNSTIAAKESSLVNSAPTHNPRPSANPELHPTKKAKITNEPHQISSKTVQSISISNAANTGSTGMNGFSVDKPLSGAKNSDARGALHEEPGWVTKKGSKITSNEHPSLNQTATSTSSQFLPPAQTKTTATLNNNNAAQLKPNQATQKPNTLAVSNLSSSHNNPPPPNKLTSSTPSQFLPSQNKIMQDSLVDNNHPKSNQVAQKPSLPKPNSLLTTQSNPEMQNNLTTQNNPLPPLNTLSLYPQTPSLSSSHVTSSSVAQIENPIENQSNEVTSQNHSTQPQQTTETALQSQILSFLNDPSFPSYVDMLEKMMEKHFPKYLE